MQSEIYLSYVGDSARTIVLRPCATWQEKDTSRPLFFSLQDEPQQSSRNGQPKCLVHLEHAQNFDISMYRKIHHRPVFGCLGLIHHAGDTFIAVVTACSKVGDIRMGESIYRITAVRFFSLSGNTPDEDMIPASMTEYGQEEDQPSMVPHPCKDLEKVLSNGAFYFSPQFDLTRTIQARTLELQAKLDAESNMTYDEHFLWNLFMLKELLQFRLHLNEQEREELDVGGLLIHIIQGYVGSASFRTATQQGQMSVISRLSSRRAGTRYNTRGIDDNGNVANFVETETILSNPEWCFAYTQIRGSVPVFWEQQGLQLVSHKIQLSRGVEATQPAVKRHFDEMVQRYEDVHIVDLLGIKDQGEVTLSDAYRTQVEMLGYMLEHVAMTKFDYHSQVKGGNYDQVQSLMSQLARDIDKYGYFFHDLVSNTVVQVQRGVFRTNCLDCLDRTNVIQSSFSKLALETVLLNLNPQDSRFSNLVVQHAELFANNGDNLSKIYTGTGALKSEVTRSGKMSLGGILGDATKSLNRFYINNFQDKGRQDVIDVLLGKMANQQPVAIYDPVHDSIASEMSARINEYSQKTRIDVFVGTYNLNGKTPSGESLESWLCFDQDVPEPDLYVIGFQEIVKLTPKQIMNTDENKRLVWEQEVERQINGRRAGVRYVQLRSGQLVGAALMVYAKEENAPYIRNVECSIKKTGLGGMAGNKGAVAIRMDYYETSLCFVTSHLASGQENLAERNNDFHTIDEGIAFARGRNIAGHDIVLWSGDFNYRVDMNNDQIRALAAQGNYFEIFKCDQLKRSIDYGEAFYGYREGVIAFPPTYRYDIGTDNYDTSEKYRAPAWTDRVLYKGNGIFQTNYCRAELKTSDHRPVMTTFVLELTILDSEAKERMEQNLYRKSSTQSLASKGSNNSSYNSYNSEKGGIGLRALLDSHNAAPNHPISYRGPVTPVSAASAVGLNGLSRSATSASAYTPVSSYVPSSAPTTQRPPPQPPANLNLPKPSSDSHQWWNDTLEPNLNRIPSSFMNPFLEDKPAPVSMSLAPSTPTASASTLLSGTANHINNSSTAVKPKPRQAPAPPPSRGAATTTTPAPVSSVTATTPTSATTPTVAAAPALAPKPKQVIDLLGDDDDDECSAPIMAAANNHVGTAVSVLSAPILVAKRMNLDTATAITSNTLGRTNVGNNGSTTTPSAVASRRAAPPPPPTGTAKGGSVEEKSEFVIDNDDDDDDSDDDDEDEDDAEPANKLLKPSELKALGQSSGSAFSAITSATSAPILPSNAKPDATKIGKIKNPFPLTTSGSSPALDSPVGMLKKTVSTSNPQGQKQQPHLTPSVLDLRSSNVTSPVPLPQKADVKEAAVDDDPDLKLMKPSALKGAASSVMPTNSAPGATVLDSGVTSSSSTTTTATATGSAPVAHVGKVKNPFPGTSFVGESSTSNSPSVTKPSLPSSSSSVASIIQAKEKESKQSAGTTTTTSSTSSALGGGDKAEIIKPSTNADEENEELATAAFAYWRNKKEAPTQ